MKHLSLFVIVLFLSACAAEYEVPKGHSVAAGAAGVGHSAMTATQSQTEDAAEEDSATPVGDAGEESGGGTEITEDAACTENPAICTCLDEEDYHTVAYCECKEQEDTQHPGKDYWCDCKHLVCVDGANSDHQLAMILTCMGDGELTADCDKYYQ